MLKKLFIILFCCVGIIGNTTAQHFPVYDLQKDSTWLNSLRRIVKKGDIPESKTYIYAYRLGYKKYWNRQFPFMNSCLTLGLYYEKLFETHRLPDMKMALYYYNKVIDMARFPDDEQAYKASALRTTLSRKLADIYFKGKGVKKNKKKSLEYALFGFTNKALFEFYSQRYFNCTCVILNSTARRNFSENVVFNFRFNPFSSVNDQTPQQVLNKYLDSIAIAFKKRYVTEDLQILVVKYSSSNWRKRNESIQLLEKISKRFIHQMNIDRKLVFYETRIEDEFQDDLEITFVKQIKFRPFFIN